MKLKKIAVFSALALTLTMGLMVFGGRRVQAAGTWYVSPTGAPSGTSGGSCTSPSTNTIGAAIALASNGDTIQVCAGTYNEQVQITKTLTLKGAQAGHDARTRVATPTSESIINYSGGPVQIMADNVVLDGFTVQGSTGTDPNFIAGIWTNPGFSGTQGGHQILNNIVQNNISGIELDSTCVNPTLVQFNLIQNNNNPGPGTGNGIQTNFGLCNATIDNNKFSGDTSSSILVVAASSGLAVSNNQLVAGTPEGIAFINVSSSTITGNTSVGSTSSATIDLFGANDGITISCNLLATGQRGIFVENPYGTLYGVAPNTNITVHQNNIQGNVIAGLQVDAGAYSPGILDAKNNWWGSPTGPTSANNPSGTGDKVIDPDNAVAFFPYLTSTSTCAAILHIGPPTNKDQCKNDGWKAFNTPRTFKNQGDCIQYVNTGK